MSKKTNAIRILEQAAFPFRLQEYEVTEDLSALHVAEQLGISLQGIYKTLVLQANTKEFIVAVIAADAQLDLKKMAQAVAVKNCAMLPLADLLKITGYMRGGCSPIGMKKLLRTVIDSSAESLAEFTISGGRRGLQIIMNPKNLGTLIHAKFDAIV